MSEEKLKPVKEESPFYGFVTEIEDERLLKDALRPAIEKLQMFTKSLRKDATLNKIKQNSKPV